MLMSQHRNMLTSTTHRRQLISINLNKSASIQFKPGYKTYKSFLHKYNHHINYTQLIYTIYQTNINQTDLHSMRLISITTFIAYSSSHNNKVRLFKQCKLT